MKWDRVVDHIVDFIRQKVDESGSDGAVVGLSGGIDSSLTAFLTVRALGEERVLGLILPERGVTAERDIEDAELVARTLDIEHRIIDISGIFGKYRDTLMISDDETIPSGNLKARIRMSILYYHANKLNRIVVGTGNRTELLVGYFTKYGDGGVDILPIGFLYKTEIFELARQVGVPGRIISKTPTAGLWSGQTDEGELGITYEELDSILKAMEKEGEDEKKVALSTGHDIQEVRRVFEMVRKSAHKRELPPIPERPSFLRH